jgi:fibronectin type 3 domain-containing protein
MEAGKLLLKPLLGENNNLNVNHRVTVKTRIGPDGKLNQEQTVEEINGNIPSDTISLSTEEIEAMELIENEKKNGSEV